MNSLNLPCRELALAFFLCSSQALAQQPQIASLSSTGGQGNHESLSPALSANGRFVAFASAANNLVPNDTNSHDDIYLRDLALATTTRISVSSSGVAADSDSDNPVISASGNRIGFVSASSLLAPLGPGASLPPYMFVHDVPTGTTALAGIDDQGHAARVVPNQSVLSADGRHVLFLVDTTDSGSAQAPWYVRDLQAQTSTRLVTNDPTLPAAAVYSEGQFLGAGRWIGFTRLDPAGMPTSRVLIIDRDSDQNGVFDEAGTITRKIIEPSQGAAFVRLMSSSRNGRFFSYSAAAPGASTAQLWLHDRDPDGDGVFDQASAVPDLLVESSFVVDSGSARVSQVTDDGRFVLYLMETFTAGAIAHPAIVRNMQTGESFVQGVKATTGETIAVMGTPTISADGLSIAASMGTLIPADTNGQWDVYSIPHQGSFCEPNLFYGDVIGNSFYGLGAVIHVLGSARISTDDFTLQAQYMPDGAGQFFYGPVQVSVPFGEGIRLVGGGQAGLFRLPIVQSAGHVATFQLHFGSPPAIAGPGAITPGSTWNFQYVFRDPAGGPAGFNTTNAVSVTFCP